MARELIKTITDKEYKNLLINGAFDFWQRGGGLAHPVGANSAYLADRWYLRKEVNHQVTQGQSSDIPVGSKSKYSHITSINTPYANANGEVINFYQKIEGQNIKDILGKKAILSFYVKSNVIGTYGVKLQSHNGHQVLRKTFTIDVANTWERKSILIEEIPDDGFWNEDENTGLEVHVILGCHANQQVGVADTWDNLPDLQSSEPIVDFGNESGGVIRFTEFMLHEGDQVQSFRTAGISYAEELLLCQRYYEKSYEINTPPRTNTSQGVMQPRIKGDDIPNTYSYATVYLSAPKRNDGYVVTTWPLTGNDTFRCSNGSGALMPPSSCVPTGFANANSKTTNKFDVSNQSGGVVNVNQYVALFHWQADNEL